MFCLSFVLLAAAFLDLSLAQNVTEIESTIQFLFPNYCVKSFMPVIAHLTFPSALS